MKIFLSYSHKDSELAKQITEELLELGLDVWNAETEILPGDNWAEKISQALESSEAMIVLLTPESLASKTVEREIQYALGNNSYKNRLIPVLVGSEESVSEKSIPWILKRLNTIRLSKPAEVHARVSQIANILEGKALPN